MRELILLTSALVAAVSDHKVGTDVHKMGVFPDAAARSCSYGGGTTEAARRRELRTEGTVE